MAWAGSLTPKWPLCVGSRQSCCIYAAPALLRVKETQRKQHCEILRVRNLGIFCAGQCWGLTSGLLKATPVHTKSRDVCSCSRHHSAPLTSSPMFHTNTALSCSDFMLHFLSDLQAPSPEREPLFLLEEWGLCAWQLPGHCCPPGICIIGHKTN